MQAAGLKSLGPTSDEFTNKIFFPYKNYVLRSTYLLHHPVHVVTRYFNYQVNKKLDVKQIFDEHNPQAFMTFGNELFMRQFYLKLRQNY